MEKIKNPITVESIVDLRPGLLLVEPLEFDRSIAVTTAGSIPSGCLMGKIVKGPDERIGTLAVFKIWNGDISPTFSFGGKTYRIVSQEEVLMTVKAETGEETR